MKEETARRVGRVARKAWRNWEQVRHIADRLHNVLRIDGCIVRISIRPDPEVTCDGTALQEKELQDGR